MNNEITRSVAEAIRHDLESLTPAERKAAMVLLANYPVPGLQTVAQFAKQADVSNPTILRLIGKLGFASYAGFQQALRDELESRLRSPLTKDIPAGHRPAAAGFLDEFRQSVLDSVTASLRGITGSEFDGAIAMLADPRRPVAMIGGRLTSSLALQFFLHLRELRPQVELVERQTATWAEYLLDVGPRNVLIVFDIRRYQEDVVRFANAASERGADVVLFTDEWLSPVAAVARHVFALRTAIASQWDSFAPFSALIEAMIARLSSQRWPEVRQRMEQLEKIRVSLAPRPL